MVRLWRRWPQLNLSQTEDEPWAPSTNYHHCYQSVWVNGFTRENKLFLSGEIKVELREKHKPSCAFAFYIKEQREEGERNAKRKPDFSDCLNAAPEMLNGLMAFWVWLMGQRVPQFFFKQSSKETENAGKLNAKFHNEAQNSIMRNNGLVEWAR